MDAPASIGRYEVLRTLGQGGMGRVFLAKDTVLGRHVAVKVVRDDLGIPPEMKAQLFARMRQEAKAAAALSHPNMVTLHDMGEEATVGLYLVFEYIDGPTLRERLDDGPLSLTEAAELARLLGAALTHAHEAGVLHRDVKPENVMLARTGPKLTDFGLARLPDSTLTAAGSVLGTPAYSAPEALALAEFSPRSDQFSLAATLYEAVSGERAFPGDDMLAVATRVAMEPPAPLGAVLRALAPADRVMARALAKDKDGRFESCARFGDALASALTIAEDRDAPVASARAAPRAPRKLQNVAIGAGIVVLVGTFFMARRTEAPSEGVSLRAVATSFASTLAARPPAHRSSPPHAPLPAPASQAPAASASATATATASATTTATATPNATATASAPPPSTSAAPSAI